MLLGLAIAGLGPLSPGIAVAQPQATPVLAPPVPTAVPAIIDARLGEHPGKTRFVLELSQETPFSVAAERDPWRVSIDLPEMTLMPPVLPPARGEVRRLRREAAARGVRLVLDTVGPVRVAWAAIIPPRDGKPPRFILDLEPVAAALFAGDRVQSGIVPAALPAAAAAKLIAPPSAVAVMPAVVAVPPAPAGDAALIPRKKPLPAAAAVLPAAIPRAAVPSAAIPSAAVPRAADLPPRLVAAAIGGMGVPVPVPRTKPVPPEKPLIVIDPGHGGKDPGAIAVNGLHEKDVTLKTALELRRQLLASGRYRVALTREADVSVRLRDRVAKARALNPDMFISLHADSIGRKEVRGLSIYTLSDRASDREADMLAQRENRADAIVGMDLSAEADEVVSILINLAQRDTRNQSLRLATLMVGQVGREVKLLPNPQRSAGFAVLTAPDVPSVLVEMGYLSHPGDAKLLSSATHRQNLARGLVRAIDDYFGGPVFASRS